MRQILLIGDSLIGWGYITGWVTSLSAAFSRSANVVNAGAGGYNTRWILQNLQSDDPYVPPVKPNQEVPLFVVISLGANDAADPNTNHEHVPLEEYETNLRAIIEWVKMNLRPEFGVLVLAATPPSEEHWARVWAEECGSPLDSPSDRTIARTRTYRDVARRVSAESKVSVIDLFKVFQVSEEHDKVGEWADCFMDGLHFNDKGDKLVFDAIMKAIREDLGVVLGDLDGHPTVPPLSAPWDLPPFFDFEAIGGDAVNPVTRLSVTSSSSSSGAAAAAPLLPYITRAKRAYLIGDSITQFGFGSGWVGQLAKEFMRSTHIVNGGLSGYNTRWILKNLLSSSENYLYRMGGDGGGDDKSQILRKKHPRPVFNTIWLGANDGIIDTHFQHVPLAEFKENLKAITIWCRDILKSPCTILITPPPVVEAAWAAHKGVETSDRTLARTRTYRNAVKDVAASFNNGATAEGNDSFKVLCVDMFGAFGVKEDSDSSDDPLWSDCFVDGLHLNPKGDAIAFKAIMDVIRREVVDPAQLEWEMPNYMTFSPTSPPAQTA